MPVSSGGGGALSALLLTSALIVTSGESASAADDPYPSLPPPIGNFFSDQYIPAVVGGAQYVPAMKQWLRVPPSVMAADYLVEYNDDFSEIAHLVDGYAVDPFRSPDSDAGYFKPMRARVLAFGVVPVQFTVHLTQPTGDDGYPVPMKVDIRQSNNFGDMTLTTADAVADGQVEIRVDDVTVDGVPLDVGSSCTGSTAAILALTGPGYQIPLGSEPPTNMSNQNWRTSSQYDVVGGGPLTGSVAVPSFTGCVSASGDDVSAMLTSFAASASSPLTMRQSNFTFGGVGTYCWPYRVEPQHCDGSDWDPIWRTAVPTPTTQPD